MHLATHQPATEHKPLAAKVKELLVEEREGGSTGMLLPVSTDVAEREPSDGSGLTRREDDCRSWGLACGLALGLRFAEDPEDREQAAEEAFCAAKAAFKAWSDPMGPRPEIFPLADSLLRLWGGAVAEYERQRLTEPGRDWVAFYEAMNDLQAALGTPAPTIGGGAA